MTRTVTSVTGSRTRGQHRAEAEAAPGRKSHPLPRVPKPLGIPKSGRATIAGSGGHID